MPEVQRSDVQLLELREAHIRFMRRSADAYDKGDIFEAIRLAVSIDALVVRTYCTGKISERWFPSLPSHNCINVSQARQGHHGLLKIEHSGTTPPSITPISCNTALSDPNIRWLDLGNWLNNEIINCNRFNCKEEAQHRPALHCTASANNKNCDVCRIKPINRKTVIKLIRDKQGAHLDHTEDELELPSRTRCWTSLEGPSFQESGIPLTVLKFSTSVESDTNMLYAMVRQIATEVLLAYDASSSSSARR